MSATGPKQIESCDSGGQSIMVQTTLSEYIHQCFQMTNKGRSSSASPYWMEKYHLIDVDTPSFTTLGQSLIELTRSTHKST
jgi:hypothetical protein